MNIDMGRLEAMGFKVEVEDGIISIFPRKPDTTISNNVKRISERLGFTFAESDELSAAIHRINMFSALRKATE